MRRLINRLTYIILQVAVALVIIVFSFIISFTIVRQIEQKELSALRESAARHSMIVQAELSNEINASLNLVLGIIGFINVVDAPTQSEFDRLAEVVLRKSDIIRNIALAPQNVITYVAPLEGNEAALGLDYMTNSAQKPAVVKAIEIKSVVIAGPVNLIQGGEGLIARIPIFIGETMSEYWGIASIVVDTDKLFDKIHIESESDWLDLAIRGKDGKGLEGELVYGEEQVFNEAPVLTELTLPYGHWMIAAVPRVGWGRGQVMWSRAIFWVSPLFAVIVAFLIMRVLSSNRKMHFMALHDPLTQLANRRLFQLLAERYLGYAVRNKSTFYLIYFDLDNFKEVNDTLGHRAGDTVLQKVAEKLASAIRDTDIFARIGGDEFLILPSQIENIEELKMFCSKLLYKVGEINADLQLKAQLGCSIGVSIYPDDSETIDGLIKKADKAMYISKKKGKNQFSFMAE